jgi:glutathione S-transferase
MSLNYTLHYFPLPGRGEVIRLLFSIAGVSYTDNKITFKEFPSIKNSGRFPFAAIPVLEITQNGKSLNLAQGPAITQYLSKKFGLWPSGDENDAIAMSVVLAAEDLRIKVLSFAILKGEERQKKLVDAVTFSNIWIERVSALLGNRNYFFDKLTGADVAIFDVLKNTLPFTKIEPDQNLKSFYSRMITDPRIEKFYNKSKL